MIRAPLGGVELGHTVARQLRRKLKDLSDAAAWREANELIKFATGTQHPHTLVDINAEARKRLDLYVKRRCEEEPLAYITGYQTFWKHDFIVNPNVLIPRPCSEVVVETVVEAVTKTGTANVLDICTGSGCLLLSVLGDCTNASGVGIDVSLEALDVARANSSQLSLSPRARFYLGDMLESVSFQRAVGRNSYDYIICNPPYVTTAEMETLPTSVRSFEPTLALAAGDDGLRFYRALVDRIDELRMAQNIAAGTMIVSEVGCGQADDVAELFSSLSFVRTIQVLNDLRGVQRAVKIIL